MDKFCTFTFPLSASNPPSAEGGKSVENGIPLKVLTARKNKCQIFAVLNSLFIALLTLATQLAGN